MSNNDNESLARLVNVTVSRARGKFILIANLEYWIYKCRNSNNVFYTLLKDYEENALNVKDSLLTFMENDKKQIKSVVFFDEESYLDSLISDIRNAKEQIYISISDSPLNDDKEKKIYKSLKESIDRGIKVAVKAKEYVTLPSHWKGITWSTDEEVFPLILIDDQVLWYGTLVTKGAKMI